MKSLPILIIVLLFWSCGKTGITEIEDIERAQQVWLQKNPQSYSYQYVKGCFCVFVEEVVVEVKKDKVVAVLAPETGQDFMVEWDGELKPVLEVFPENFYTINQFFNYLIERAPNAATADFYFQESTGMPTHGYLDGSKSIADDEFSFTFSNLKID